jgi:hypothetical protein
LGAINSLKVNYLKFVTLSYACTDEGSIEVILKKGLRQAQTDILGSNWIEKSKKLIL